MRPSFELIYNSISLVDPDRFAAPTTPSFGGLSSGNPKWTHTYAQWVDLYHDDSGVLWAVVHQGGTYKSFKETSPGVFASENSYEKLTAGYDLSAPIDSGLFGPPDAQRAVCSPYTWFRLTDGDGTKYQFNVSPPSGQNHVRWAIGQRDATPHYLITSIVDRWNRLIRVSWRDDCDHVSEVKDGRGYGVNLEYDYDSVAHDYLLKRVIDPQGRTHTLSYTSVPNESGINCAKLSGVTVQGPGSPRVAYTWGFAYHYPGNQGASDAAYGQKYTGDLVIERTDPDGQVVKYTYAPVTLTQDPPPADGPAAEDYDGRIKTISWTDSSEGTPVTKTITRNVMNSTTRHMVYPGDQTTRYTYSSDNDNLTVQDMATQATWSYTYENHNPKTVRTPVEASGGSALATLNYTYSNGRITHATATDIYNKVVETDFNAFNQPTDVVVPAAVEERTQRTRYGYDAYGNLTSIIEALGTALAQTTNISFAGDVRLPQSVTNPVGGVTTFVWDAGPGRLTETHSPPNYLATEPDTDALASESITAYNADGLPSLLTDPEGHQVSITYAADPNVPSNLVTTLTLPGSTTRKVTVDACGRTVETRDENDVATRWSYNPQGQATSVRRYNPSGALLTETKYSYDDRGDLRWIQPPKGEACRTYFDYVSMNEATGEPTGTYQGQVTRIRYPDGRKECFGYNTAGELVWQRKGDGGIVNIQPDSLHRPHIITYPPGPGNPAGFTVTYNYDEFDRVESVAHSTTGTTTYEYDDLNRLVSVSPPSPQKRVDYEYIPEVLGAQTQQPRCRWITKMTVQTVGDYYYKEDTKGRVAQIVNAFGQTFTMRYDRDGKLREKTFPNGVKEFRDYNNRDWVNSIVTTGPNGVDPAVSMGYQRQLSGHILSETETVSGADPVAHTFAYDWLYRLTAENHPAFGTVTYNYDPNGNRTSRVFPTFTEYYGVDAADRLLWVNQNINAEPTPGQTNPYTRFEYDANGRAVRRDRRTTAARRVYDFWWDGDDRLRKVAYTGSLPTPPETWPNPAATEVFRATYDGGGVRDSAWDAWKGQHNYSWSAFGIVHDANSNRTFTPGAGAAPRRSCRGQVHPRRPHRQHAVAEQDGRHLPQRSALHGVWPEGVANGRRLAAGGLPLRRRVRLHHGIQRRAEPRRGSAVSAAALLRPGHRPLPHAGPDRVRRRAEPLRVLWE